MRVTTDEARTSIVLVFDQRERVEAARLRVRCGLARDAPSLACHVFQPVERNGVAHEAAVHEDARQRALVGGVEAQLDALLGEVRAHLEKTALPPHGAVLADDALFAMEEDLVEVDPTGYGPELIGLREHVLGRGAARGLVDTSMVFGPEPGPMLGVELRERKRLVR